jgi:OmpA-OmpF porin, OOP family
MRTNHALYPCLLTAVGIALLTAPSLAQPKAQQGEFSVQRFEPAPGTKNYLSVAGLRMDGAWGFSVGLAFDYARNPFVVLSCRSQTNCTDKNTQQAQDVPVIQDMFTLNLLAAVSPARPLQIGLRAPFVYANGSGFNADTGTAASAPLKALGAGDPTLEVKVRLFGGAHDPYLLGLAAEVSAPLGHVTSAGHYLGNDSPVTGGVRAIFDGQAGPLSFGLNLRGVFRKPATLGSTTVGPADFRYGAGMGLRVSPIFRILAEGYGSTQFSAKNGTTTLEVDGAFEVTPLSSPVSFKLGGGAGVIEGIGVPVGRAIAMLTIAREVGDQDGDGIADANDKCPSIPEDNDGFEDDDGCPDDDNDGDRVADDKDKCPNQPETINGLKDDDGCPDEIADRDKDGIPDDEDKCPEAGGKTVNNRPGPNYGCPDRDQDGIPDKDDKCADQPEDTDGFEDTDGCPDADNDKDGISDESDECIDQPEVMNGFKDQDGCPDELPDRDKDGIPDAKDKCPDKPENYNGIDDEDGCPEKGPALVQMEGTTIKILEQVEFATGKDKIQGAKSFSVLDAVTSVLKGHPEIFRVEVSGHTDNAGSAADNRALSQKRAEAVVAYLTSKGISERRLTAKGYGPDKPLVENSSKANKQKNRRVEFTILKSSTSSDGR